MYKYIIGPRYVLLVHKLRPKVILSNRLQEAADEDAEANAAEEEEERFDLIEFAENYFNDHEKSPAGTIVGTLKRGGTAGNGKGFKTHLFHSWGQCYNHDFRKFSPILG
jgi:hypothetical protein